MKKLQKPIKERHGDGTEHWHRGNREGGHGFVDRKEKGSTDLGLLPYLIPWHITPVPTGGCDAAGNCSDTINWGSLEPVGDNVYQDFCGENPSSPNCVDDCL